MISRRWWAFVLATSLLAAAVAAALETDVIRKDGNVTALRALVPSLKPVTVLAAFDSSKVYGIYEHLVVSVTDDEGLPVADLKPSDFVVKVANGGDASNQAGSMLTAPVDVGPRKDGLYAFKVRRAETGHASGGFFSHSKCFVYLVNVNRETSRMKQRGRALVSSCQDASEELAWHIIALGHH